VGARKFGTSGAGEDAMRSEDEGGKGRCESGGREGACTRRDVYVKACEQSMDLRECVGFWERGWRGAWLALMCLKRYIRVGRCGSGKVRRAGKY